METIRFSFWTVQSYVLFIFKFHISPEWSRGGYVQLASRIRRIRVKDFLSDGKEQSFNNSQMVIVLFSCIIPRVTSSQSLLLLISSALVLG